MQKSDKSSKSSNDSDFIIHKENITYIRTPDGERESYTFFIEKEYKRNLNFVENLVLSKKKNSDKYEAILITYFFPDGYMIDNKDFQVLKTTPLDIDLNLFNKSSTPLSKTSGEGCSYSIIETEHKCYSGEHSGAGESGKCDHKGNGPYSTYELYLFCGGAGGGGGYNPSEPGSGSGGTQTGPPGSGGNNGNGGANNGIDTGITLPPSCQGTQCDEVVLPNQINILLGKKLNISQLMFLYNNENIANHLFSILNNYNTHSQETYLWVINYLSYIDNISAADYFNQNPQDLDILFALGVDFFTQNPNISWDYLENWFFNGNNLNSSVMNEYLQDLKNPDIVKPTKRFKNNTKINGIYNQAKTASNFKQYLKNFEPTFSVAHLLFDIGEITQGNYAVTSVPKDYWIKITFNQSVDWNNTPKIIIADTFMHEMIHAEIFRKLLSIGSTNGNIDVNKITQYLNTHNYPGLFDYYVERTVGGENWQHEAMGAHYVNIMVNFLKQLYNNKYTDVEYKTIVWMGLKGTIAWNSLSQTERTLYETTWNEKYWTWEL